MSRNRVPKGVEAGTGTYFGGAVKILWPKYGSKLIVGNYSLISAGVTFFLGGHHKMDRVSMRLQRKGNSSYSKGDIRIGSDVWIGHGAVILDGITIGDGAVVGAFAVVASDVPPYVLVAGNPARQIRTRFSPEVIEALLRIRWWDWPTKMLAEAMPLLRSDRIEDFVRKYG